jgi:DNA polymerase V
MTHKLPSLQLPYYESVSAGFPSPAEDHMDRPLNLNDLLIERPASTFMIKVEGNSMQNAGIFSDDILIVDRSLKAELNNVVVALIDGEFTVKRYIFRKGRYWLCPENDHYQPIDVTYNESFRIWGVVRYVIHKPS